MLTLVIMPGRYFFQVLIGFGTALTAWCQVPVYTGQYNLSRTSANLSESVLNLSNVTSSGFGLLFSRSVDAQVYAQPLYVPAVTIAGKTQNVVYVATMNNSVYAFDADTAAASSPLWQVNLGPAAPINQPQLSPIYGILGTPVIDPSTGTLYAVAATLESNGVIFRLHALDITSGVEKFNGPAVIQASVPGSAPDAVNGTLSFRAAVVLQRPALLLAGGVIHIGFGAINENPGHPPYHGWMLGYQAGTLAQSYAFSTTPNGTGGGIWMSGVGPAVDTNGIYFAVGNGSAGAGNLGETVMRVGSTGGYFLPAGFSILNEFDWDLGAGGPMLIPGSNLLAIGGKTGDLYLLNRTNPGQFEAGDAGAVQSFQESAVCSAQTYNGCFEIHHLTMWPRSSGTSWLYVWAWNDPLKAFAFSGGLLTTTPASQNTSTVGYPGGILALSANGNQNGILWAVTSVQGYTGDGSAAGVLHAFNAANVGQELWNSNMKAGDALGTISKFAVPVVTNGKVYVATGSNSLRVYGLQ